MVGADGLSAVAFVRLHVHESWAATPTFNMVLATFGVTGAGRAKLFRAATGFATTSRGSVVTSHSVVTSRSVVWIGTSRTAEQPEPLTV